MKKRIVKICKNNNIPCFIQFDQLVSFNYVDVAKFEDEEFVSNILRISKTGE